VSPAANGVTVRVGRNTPQTVLTDFQTGVIVGEGDLDDAYLQNLYIEQELQDVYDEAVAGAITTANLTSAVTNNLTATVAPGVGDDSADGYEVGSYWWDTVTFDLYMATDVTVGAAIWKRVDMLVNVTTTNPAVGDDVDDGYQIGSYWWNKTAGTLYFCTDNTSGAAVWQQLTASLSYPLVHTGLVEGAESSGIASAATTDLSGADGNYVTISGSTGPITSFGTVTAGTLMVLKFTGTPTIAHHITKIQLPKDLNITVQSGDMMFLQSDGADAWTCVNYLRATGQPLFEDDGLVPKWTHITPITLSTGSPTAVTLMSSLSGVDDIYIYLNDASLDLANNGVIIQVGDSGGFHVTGYDGEATFSSAGSNRIDANSAGWLLAPAVDWDAADVFHSVIHLHHVGSNVWSASIRSIRLVAGVAIRGLGQVTLDTELTQVRLTTEGGTAVFDGGSAYGSSN
jgi:hypothetical protein